MKHCNIDWNEIRQDIEKILTDYEGNGDPDLKDDPAPLYDFLCDLQNAIE